LAYAEGQGTASRVMFRRSEFAVGNSGLYGQSCANNTYFDGHPPWAGSQGYYHGVFVPDGTSAIGLLGFASLDLPLDTLGMTGCRLLVDPTITVNTVATNGEARMSIDLPDDPVFLGELYVQWAWLQPGANRAGVVTGRGARIDVE
jgi:hypothetical protein